MKRIADTSATMLPPVRMHMEDVEHILELLKKDMTTEIQYLNYSYESLAELKSNIQRDSISQLRIEATRDGSEYGYLNIDIQPDGVRLSANDGATERRAHIAELLRSKMRWYSWMPMKAWWHGLQGGIAGLLLVSAAGLVFVALPVPAAAEFGLIVLIVGGGTIMLVSDRVWLGGTKIYLSARFGKPTFWMRNRDAVLVGVISSVISVLIGYLAGYMSR